MNFLLTLRLVVLISRRGTCIFFFFSLIPFPRLVGEFAVS